MLEVDDDGFGQGPGVAVRPEGLELLLDPLHRGRLVVRPEQLVVAGPGFSGLVDGAQEASRPSIRVADHTRLAVDETE